ncbi:hypothetical protein [Cystobacter fuscus]|uniref:hypothetical protein n=1 Tax=Cystobacter fuscus TaxID=43 RepID=UPI0012FE17A3|nr:hypothetical protein [Cystobacter fuscus]
MTIFEELTGATLFIETRRRAAEAKGRQDEEKLWRYVRAFNHFVLITGQIYRFEDSLEGKAPAERPSVSANLGKHEGTLAEPAVELLLKTLDETPELEQKQHARLLIALLDFIAGLDSSMRPRTTSSINWTMPRWPSRTSPAKRKPRPG